MQSSSVALNHQRPLISQWTSAVERSIVSSLLFYGITHVLGKTVSPLSIASVVLINVLSDPIFNTGEAGLLLLLGPKSILENENSSGTIHYLRKKSWKVIDLGQKAGSNIDQRIDTLFSSCFKIRTKKALRDEKVKITTFTFLEIIRASFGSELKPCLQKFAMASIVLLASASFAALPSISLMVLLTYSFAIPFLLTSLQTASSIYILIDQELNECGDTYPVNYFINNSKNPLIRQILDSSPPQNHARTQIESQTTQPLDQPAS